jgi:hypothetical protein
MQWYAAGVGADDGDDIAGLITDRLRMLFSNIMLICSFTGDVLGLCL